MAMTYGVFFLLVISALCVNAEEKCSVGFVFDSFKQTCSSVHVKEPQCPADQDPEIFIPHKECNKYYICFMGSLYVFTCPPGLEFNIDTNECDWPSPNGCSSTTEVPETTPGVTEPTTVETEPTTEPATTVTEPATTVTEPDTTVTEPVTTVTEPATTVTEPATTVTEPTTTVKPIKCSFNDNFKKFPHDSDCTKYYMCLLGKRHEYSCGWKRGFHNQQKKCVPIKESSCNKL